MTTDWTLMVMNWDTSFAPTARRMSVAQVKAHLSAVLREAASHPTISHNRGRDVAVPDRGIRAAASDRDPRGGQSVGSARKRRFLESWFAALLDGPSEIVELGREAAIAAARIETQARRQGRPVELRDLFILASAKVNDLHIATRNVAHFRGL